MKPLAFLILAGLASTAIRSGAQGDPIYALTPAYRHVVRLDEGSISPFRKPEVRALQAASPKLSGLNISAVIAKFNELGLTGVIPTKGDHRGLIILGGTIYREGQEISIYDAHGRGKPLLGEHKVVLQSVTPQALGLLVSHLGDEDKAPASVPIVLMEFRDR